VEIIRQAPLETHADIHFARDGFPLDSHALIEILIIVLNFTTWSTRHYDDRKSPLVGTLSAAWDALWVRPVDRQGMWRRAGTEVQTVQTHCHYPLLFNRRLGNGVSL